MSAEPLPAAQENEIDLYRFGIDTIIGGTVQFAAPFHSLSKRILKQAIYKGNLREYPASACQADLEWFLAKFFVFSAGFVQIVSERLAETIRRNTHRSDVRSQTTMSLAKSIRTESFADVELALKNFTTVANGLGIALENTSTLRNSIGGAFVGGGLEFLMTDAADTEVGSIAGAIIGGAIAEAKKSELREAMWDSAIKTVKTITELIGLTPARLMDQYVSLVFGEKTDFAKRDREIEYGRKITTEISNSCVTVFEVSSQLLDWYEAFSRLDITRCSVFEIPLLPKKRQEHETLLKEELGKLTSWHNYIEQLQASCTAGIMNEARSN